MPGTERRHWSRRKKWGVGQRMFFLHDGRTSGLLQEIWAHFSTSLACVATNNGYAASEANQVIQNFNALSESDKQAVLDFLRSL
jgi:CxxC motif-containing protein (DUF1111 family)